METMRLGRTNLIISRTGFGAIPIQRISAERAATLLRKAYDAGITFFDTARGYTDSEAKIGQALHAVRQHLVLATKTPAQDAAGVQRDLETSLRNLRTDCVDLLQVHNPEIVFRPGGADGVYDALSQAKQAGKIRFIGLTNHRLPVALEAVESGLYDTIQYPLSYLSTPKDLAVIQVSQQQDVGVIAMKALSGGLITNARPAFAFLRQYPNVVPIWGLELETQLAEILALEAQPPALDATMWQTIERDRTELAGAFCRGCGYCMPCPVEIPINMAARLDLLMRRMPYQRFLRDDWRDQMERITQCTECRQCASQCPYGLDVPNLLKRQLTAYRNFQAPQA
jgi:uncharacterized protein